MYNFNEHIRKELLNEYGGSERKRTVILDDGKKYLLKFPDPIRESGRNLSYINNALSEYIACKIIREIGVPVQDVILGQYTDERGITKIACACQDVRSPGESMYEIEKLQLGSLDPEEKDGATFAGVEKIISKLADENTRSKLLDHFYDMFVVDTFLGNPDRHNGNWAVLSSNAGDIRPCPIFDCGSSLSPLIDDDSIRAINVQREAMNVVSAIRNEDLSHLKYADFYNQRHLPRRVFQAMLRVLPAINLNKIHILIDNTEGLSDTRKKFYRDLLDCRYERILLPALARNLNPVVATNANPVVDVYQFYKDELAQLSDIDYEQRTVQIQGQEAVVARAGSNHALLFDATIREEESRQPCLAVLSTRSNNDDVRTTIALLRRFGYRLKVPTNEQVMIETRSRLSDLVLRGTDAEIKELRNRLEDAKREAAGDIRCETDRKQQQERG